MIVRGQPNSAVAFSSRPHGLIRPCMRCDYDGYQVRIPMVSMSNLTSSSLRALQLDGRQCNYLAFRYQDGRWETTPFRWRPCVTHWSSGWTG